jgi:hypothetical protein
VRGSADQSGLERIWNNIRIIEEDSPWLRIALTQAKQQ